MAHSLMINFDPGQAEPNSLRHRIRNFGEAIYRYLQTNEFGEMALAEVDRATTQLMIRKVKTRHLGSLITWIETGMRREHLLGVIERG